ncbi:hypothetical protein V7S43_003939 [Phytophthora oleae]|uniref:Uncharacterized protein n=1 Tax=Phytophthora oleae TaxID=2107226 RepID=A0ABD3FYM8_9STRA
MRYGRHSTRKLVNCGASMKRTTSFFVPLHEQNSTSAFGLISQTHLVSKAWVDLSLIQRATLVMHYLPAYLLKYAPLLQIRLDSSFYHVSCISSSENSIFPVHVHLVVCIIDYMYQTLYCRLQFVATALTVNAEKPEVISSRDNG